ncbi:MAG: murein biosynthesis integral membrane protein MurJ [Anaerolineae bacterium]
MNITKSPGNIRQVARAASLVMFLFVASRAMGLLREMVIARQFGTSAELDAYLAAFRLPDLFFALMAGGALGSAFIPVFASYLAHDDETGAWRLASAIINWVFLLLSLAGAIAALLAPVLVAYLIAPGFTAAQQALSVELMRWMLVSTLIFGVSGVVMGILNARQHFLLPALAPVIYNAAIIAGVWFLGPALGVRGATIGVVLGAAGHLLVQLPELRRQGMRYALGLAPRDPGVREVGRLMLPRALGQAAVELNHLVNVTLASLLPAGSISALNYGRLMMLLPQGVIAQSVAIAAFPTFSTLAARGERAELRHILTTSMRSVLYLTLPAAVGLVWLREPLVSAIFRGGEFDTWSVQATGWALLFYALGLAGHALVEIVARAFYALHDTRTPVLVGILAMLANILLSLGFISLFTRLGWMPHGGLALANSAATTGEMVILLYLIRQRLGGLDGRRLMSALWRMGLGCLAMLAGLTGAWYVLFDAPAWLVCASSIALGGAIYGVATLLLGSEEPAALTGWLRRRLRA